MPTPRTAIDLVCPPANTKLTGAQRFCNAFAYWQAQDINNATNTFFDDINQAFDHIRAVAGDSAPELWVGETGMLLLLLQKKEFL